MPSMRTIRLGDLTLESSLGLGSTARFYVEGLQEGPSEAYQARLAARSQSTGAG
jgi:hypothetical protein